MLDTDAYHRDNYSVFFLSPCLLFQKEERKVFPRHMGQYDCAVSVSISLGSSQDTRLHSKATGIEVVYRAACLITPQLSLTAPYPRRDGQAELTSQNLWKYICNFLSKSCRQNERNQATTRGRTCDLLGGCCSCEGSFAANRDRPINQFSIVAKLTVTLNLSWMNEWMSLFAWQWQHNT